MKFRQFLAKYIFVILAIIGITAAVITFAGLRIDATRDIQDQVDELYEKERLVGKNFANAYGLSGVTCYSNEDNNVIIFNSNDCSLKVTYNKNGELLTKEFNDYRLGNNFIAILFTTIGTGILAALVFGFAIAFLDYFLYEAGEKKLAKKRRQ